MILTRLAPSKLSWIVAVFLLLVQQGAFVLIPLFTSDDTDARVEYSKKDKDARLESPELHNLLSPISRVLSFVLLSIALARRPRDVVIVVADNLSVFAFAAMIFMSALWSLHPDLTLKWALNYLMAVFVAVYLVVYFPGNYVFRVLSYSLIISAVGSILFIALFPNLGMMSEEALAGNWRGVFYHKNVMGEVMTSAVFVQLYLFATGGHRVWSFFWAALFYGLVVVSRSESSLIVASLYVPMFFIYLLWMQHRIIGYGAATMFIIFLAMMTLLVLGDFATVLDLMGKDSTLTGRIDLWTEVTNLISVKPLLGWGFGAMFINDDSATTILWERVGWLAATAHNSYLQTTLELGYLGLLLMGVFIASSIRKGFLCCRMGVLPLGYFALVSFVGSLIAGWSEASLGQASWPWLVFMLLALVCRQGIASKQQLLLESRFHPVVSHPENDRRVYVR